MLDGVVEGVGSQQIEGRTATVILRFEVSRAVFDNQAHAYTQEDALVNLLVTFLITVTVGIVGVSWLGVIIDKLTSPFISLLIFFPAFFLTIWLTWKLSVKLTAPKTQPQA